MNLLRSVMHQSVDTLYKSRNKLLRVMKRRNAFTKSILKSDSQEQFYAKQIEKILSKQSQLKYFRRNYNYREILEHVSFQLGKAYLERIKILSPNTWREVINANLENDTFGAPRKYLFPELGLISPTTLRYIATAMEIDQLMDFSRIKKIVEIGVGYGGQAAVISRMTQIKTYYFLDLPDVLQLSQIFLKEIDSRLSPVLLNRIDESITEYDLVISNFAFSELPRLLQINYLDKVLTRSKNGYMIMNSGRSDITGRSEGKLSISEILCRLPGAEVIEEVPLSGPDNYVLYWRS